MSAHRANSAIGSLSHDVSYDKQDFGRIATMLENAAGIRMPDSNEALVYARLSRRVRELGFSGFSEFIDLIAQPGQEPELQNTIAALTTNTTRFFREAYHFETVTRDLLPTLARDAKQGKRVRLWSAACSTGEEPYTLAAVILKTFPDAARHDFKILATDINREVLKKAEIGRYPKGSEESVDDAYRRLMFEPCAGDDKMISIRPELKALVTFRYLNFMEPWPVRGPFDAILCRNVMIYMEEATQARVWAGLASVLAQGGYLFIGHSERIGPEFRDQLELVGKTTFRKL